MLFLLLLLMMVVVLLRCKWVEVWDVRIFPLASFSSCFISSIYHIVLAIKLPVFFRINKHKSFK